MRRCRFRSSSAAGCCTGETQGWWRVPKAGFSHFQLLLWLGIAISSTPVYLITWRVGRRFGGRGLAALALASAVVGPLRDYRVAAMFPDGSPSRRGFRRSSPLPRSMHCW